MLAVYSLWRRECVRFFRDRSRVFSSLGQPVLFWVLFAAALRESSFVAGDLDLFAEWVSRERVRVIFWFKEDWVGAAKRAPFLALPEEKTAQGITFTPVAHEAGYGVVVYRVDGPGLPALEPPTPR